MQTVSILILKNTLNRPNDMELSQLQGSKNEVCFYTITVSHRYFLYIHLLVNVLTTPATLGRQPASPIRKALKEQTLAFDTVFTTSKRNIGLEF